VQERHVQCQHAKIFNPIGYEEGFPDPDPDPDPSEEEQRV